MIDHGDPVRQAISLVGVTGTDGKSSTVHLLAAALSGAGERTGTIGTLGVNGSGPASISGRTTPDAPTLYATLERLAAERARWVALECSSHGLDQGRLAGLRPVGAVLTTFARDHLDYHGSRKAYFAAKAYLFDLLPAGAVASGPERSVWTARLRARRPDLRWITWGAACGHMRGRILSQSLSGLRLALTYPDGERARLRVPLVGEFQRGNALAALALADGLGVPRAGARAGIAAAGSVPGRMELVADPGDRISVFVDFAHTPAAVRTVLAAIRKVCKGRVWVVLGCGGDRDRGKRPLMAAAAMAADRVVLTSDNPRSEDPGDIIREMLAGIGHRDRGRLLVEPNRQDAVALAIAEASPGDTVMLLGKGHETTQDVAGRTLTMDDRELARQALEARECA
ncbi:UDP-N-acetylmuramoyl-L-alanyl-D-glutamate--2,6-diaminopimelate ligase [bacterium]|nr:UDP-N-acetylmuramoyl-L-alanyl-D-glutamate--2,6-diaminopimelate ligase [bacterium]